ncbi:hypothetical protein AB3480_06435 [Rhizobium mongolense]|uniref:hypothetical protein n=1 Tax=Rhizobium mongolense TaxID=57676 RepID=UPI0034A5CF28
MFGSVGQLYDQVLAILTSGDGYFVSFAAGVIVIAFHARNRLQIIAPRGEEFDFVRLLTLPAIVGKDLFRRSCIIYTILLEVLFLFLCLSQPIFPSFIGELPGHQGGAWPLGAALVIVGLLPSVKGIDQIELMLRQFALSASNIPDEFFRRVTRLSQSEVTAYLEREPRYHADLDKYRKIYSLVIASGCAPSEAHDAARRAIGCDLFARWTLGGGAIWSAGEYDKLKDVFDVLQPKARALKREIEDLVSVASSSKVVNYILAKNLIQASQPINRDQTQKAVELASAIRAGSCKIDELSSEMEPYSSLRDRWLEESAELSVSNRRLCALFAIQAMNDRRLVREYIQSDEGDRDTVLREMLILVNKARKYSIPPVYNASLIGGAAAFLTCFVAFLIFLSISDLFYPPNSKRLGAFEYSLYTSATVLTCFIFAGLAALFFRRVSLEQDAWTNFTGFLRFPVLQYKGIIVAAAVCAIIPYIISIVAYAYRTGDVKQFADLGRYGTFNFLMFCAAWSLIPATFAVGLCLVTDVESSQRGEGFYTVAIISASIVLFVAFVVHQSYISVDGRYREIFWSGLISTGTFALIGLLVFGRSLREYRKGAAQINVAGDGGSLIQDRAGI